MRNSATSNERKPEIPESVGSQWQTIVDLIARMCGVSSALVFRAHASEIEVVVASQGHGNPYRPGTKVPLSPGVYCGEVISKKGRLLVPNALDDPKFDHNPHVKLGMVSYLGYPLLWPDGEVYGTICILDAQQNAYSEEVTDILALFRKSIETSLALLYKEDLRKRAEVALQQREEDYRRLVEQAGDGIFVLDTAGRFILVNAQMCRILGYTREEMSRLNIVDTYIDRERDATVKRVSELREGEGIRLEHLMVRQDGTQIPVEASATRLSNGRLQAIVRDTSHRKKTEAALQETTETLQSVFQASPAAIIIVGAGGKVRMWNPAAERMFGWTSEEVIGLPNPSTPYHLREESRLLREQVLRGEGIRGIEVSRLRKDGTTIEISLSAAPLRDLQGRVVGVLQVILDITDRRRTEDLLFQTRHDWEDILDSITDMITIHDKDFNIISCNKAAQQILSLPDIGTPNALKCYKFYHGESCPPEACPSCKCLESGEPVATEVFEPHLNKFVEIRAIPRFDRNGQISGVIHIVRDISERKRTEQETGKLEKQLRQAQKMEAVGTLAGGVAHDFNNLLTVVLGYSELLLGSKQKGDPDYSDIQKIHYSARKGADLVKRLLTFSRKVEPEPVPVDLNRQIVQFEKLLRRTIPRMIDIELKLSSGLAKIYADPNQMEQVLMNLAVNARDAMPDGGKLKIATQNITLDEEFCRFRAGTRPGDYVLLTVTDTGHGMDKATVEHVFEPFFTTKEPSRGTGLGLAMVYGIVSQHSGIITCYSELGQGTVFNVYLPAIPSREYMAVDDSGIMPAFGDETILLVDDAEFVRDLGVRILGKAGYTVLHAADGRQATEIFRAERSRISLVVLDLIMPKMGGKECLKELLRIDPGMKILISSGYSADTTVTECLDMGAKGFVSKPFRMKELLRQVRNVLDQA